MQNQVTRRISLKAALFVLIFTVALPPVSAAAQTNPPPPPPPPPPTPPTAPLNVRSFGAVGDGKTKDTPAFQKALDACASAGGGTVAVPAGNYLIGSISLGSNTTLRLQPMTCLIGSADIDDYPVVHSPWEADYSQGRRSLLSASKASHVTITGHGWICGPPPSLRRANGANGSRGARGPLLMEFSECDHVTLDGFDTVYAGSWSIHPLLCRDFLARNLVIRSIGVYGDGIDVDSCSGVRIENCNIDSGDDAIALKSGRGLAAVQLARPTENVEITHCSLISSNYAGLGIGTELSGGIRNVHMDHCIISGHQNAIFIKSRDGRAGFIDNILGENLTVYNSPTFVAIDLLDKGTQAVDPVPGRIAQWTAASNIRFSNVRVIDIAALVVAGGIPADRPLDGLTLSNITGNCGRAITLANMTHVVLSNINVTGYQGPLVTQSNVQGTGLDGAK
jgi:polygalacturonase